MSTMSIDASAALAAADQSWNSEYGDPPSEPAYLQHLAEFLTSRGWVHVHNHHTDEGRAQNAQLAERVRTSIEQGQTPEFIASDVLIALLNSTHETETRVEDDESEVSI